MPGETLIQPDIQFTTNPNVASDVCIVLNHLPYDTKVITNRKNIWRWDLESSGVGNPAISKVFTKIFSNYESGARVLKAPPVLNWWVDKTFDELYAMQPLSKSRMISCIASSKSGGTHLSRFNFVAHLERTNLGIDIFGRGRTKELENKWEGLKDYRFTVAIENRSKDDYWTEKLADALLSYCVPFYWGAPNVTKYFPQESFIWLPVEDPISAEEIIRRESTIENYQRRLPAVIEARSIILERYSLWAQIRDAIRREGIAADKTSRRLITLPGLNGRRNLPGSPARAVKASLARLRLHC